jgi:hypothetical protein
MQNIELAWFSEDGDAVGNVKKEDVKKWMMAQIVSEFGEDVAFLSKINKITFGLISGK